VFAGEPMLSPAVTRRLIAHVTDPEATARRKPRRCAAWAAYRTREGRRRRDRSGEGNGAIGAELFMKSVATVKAHITRVLTTLELNTRVQVTLRVNEAGASDHWEVTT
jgi:DNA-binding NarL/FixJ family response regulator